MLEFGNYMIVMREEVIVKARWKMLGGSEEIDYRGLGHRKNRLSKIS